MKVLMIGLTPPVEGGSQRHVYEISSRLGEQVLTQKGSICKNKIELPILKSSTFLINISFFISCMIYSLKLLLVKKHNIVHIHENLLYILALILGVRYKTIITIHGLTGFRFYENKILWFFFKNCLKMADAIICVDICEKKIIEKLHKNVVYIPNGVDISLYKKIKINKVEKKITFLGRIHEQKGVAYLIKAFYEIKEKARDFKLVIIGEINDYAKQLQKEFPDKKIVWKGFILDRRKIFEELKSSYALVYPSLWEALPWPALLEGLASGRPVIASNLEGMEEVFSSNEIMLSKAGNAEELSKKMLYLINNKRQAEKIGKFGGKKAKKFDWNSCSEKLRSVYEKYSI